MPKNFDDNGGCRGGVALQAVSTANRATVEGRPLAQEVAAEALGGVLLPVLASLLFGQARLA